MKKLYEEFLESADYVIKTFFQELETEVKDWFTNGSLAAQNCQLDETETDLFNPMQKYLIVKFISLDDNYFYHLIYIVRVDELNQEDNQIQKIHLKIKRYENNDQSKLVSELLDEIDIEDANKEDFIIGKIDELKGVEPEKKSDLKDNIYEK